MVIAHNMMAMNAQRQFNIVGTNKKKSMEKLSSGYKINRAADDAAGLSISEKMRRQIRGLNQGANNTQDGISLLQVADGALAEVQDMLHRVTELSIKSANGTNTDEDRQAIQEEINQIMSEVDRISDSTEFNTRKLFRDDGTSHSGPYSYISGYRTEVGTVTKDIYTDKQFTFNISGSPTDSSAMTYTVSTTDTGLKINSDSSIIKWSDIKDASNHSLDINNIQSGSYSFTYKGMKLSFNIDEPISKENFISGINGVKWSTKESGGGGLEYDLQASIVGGSYRTVTYRNGISDGIGYERGDLITITPNGGAIGINTTWFKGYTLYWKDFVDDEGNNLDPDNIHPGTYKGQFEKPYVPGNYGEIKIDFTLTIGDNNTSSFNEITRKMYDDPDRDPRLCFLTDVDNFHSITKANDTPPKLVELDEITNIPKYTKHETKTEEVTKQIPIYTTVTPPKPDNEAKNLWIQSGAEVGDGMFITIDYMDTTMLGIDALDVTTVDNSLKSIDKASKATDKISEIRSALGAQQNRLEHTYKNVTNIAENTQAAESRIRDTDMAKEMVNLSIMNILEQAGQSMMAQANQSNQGVLALIQ